jgi:hypothetical protein
MTRREAWVRFAAAVLPAVIHPDRERWTSTTEIAAVANMADYMLAEMDKRFASDDADAVRFPGKRDCPECVAIFERIATYTRTARACRTHRSTTS